MLHTGLRLLHSPQQVNAIKCQIVKKKKKPSPFSKIALFFAKSLQQAFKQMT